jgi:hypothetical protein
MVKVSAPAMSLDASGSLAGALVFSKWKGRNYVRQLITPSNPKSGPQIGVRAMFRFLSQIWDGLSAADKATWETRADQTVISPFNAFMSVNQGRWRNFEAPGKVDPVTEAGTPGVYANEAATGGVRQIDVQIEVTTLNDAWAVAIFRDPSTGFNTAFSNCIAVIPTESAAVFHHIDTPLDPGTYYYNFRGISGDGDLNAEEGEVSAAAT